MPLYQLTDEDVQLLRELHAEKRGRRQSNPTQSQPLDEVPAPEVYLVWIPDGGIPAASEGLLTGTGATDLADDVFSGVNCYCYRISESTGKPIPRNRRVKVYNKGPNAADENQWAVAVRDKWGKWWISGATSTVEFTVVTDASFNVVTCEFTKTTSTIRITGSNLSVEVL